MPVKPDPRIDAYIGKAAPFAQPILARIRELVRKGCPDAEETMKWSVPHFTYSGKILCCMASFKAHLTFGFWHQGMDKILAKELGRTGEGMGLFGKITSQADLPDDKTLLRYIKTAAEFNASEEPARPRPAAKSKPEATVPADLAAELKKNKKASATWEKFSPSHRREYVEWLTGAKREDTRAKRLATTVEWLSEGKPRHWKYMNC